MVKALGRRDRTRRQPVALEPAAVVADVAILEAVGKQEIDHLVLGQPRAHLGQRHRRHRGRHGAIAAHDAQCGAKDHSLHCTSFMRPSSGQEIVMRRQAPRSCADSRRAASRGMRPGRSPDSRSASGCHARGTTPCPIITCDQPSSVNNSSCSRWISPRRREQLDPLGQRIGDRHRAARVPERLADAAHWPDSAARGSRGCAPIRTPTGG